MPVHALPAPVRVHMISPLTFNDAQQVADHVKAGDSVFLDMRAVDRALDERLRDFCLGLTAAVEGSVTDVAQGILLIAPAGVSVSRGASGAPGHDAAPAAVMPLFGSMTA